MRRRYRQRQRVTVQSVIGLIALVAALVAWAPPATSTPFGKTSTVAQSGAQARAPLLKRISRRVGRLFRGLIRPKPMEPLQQMKRSGRLSPADYNAVLRSLGRPVPPDPADLARRRLYRKAKHDKHLRPLVRFIRQGALSDSEIVQVDRGLNRTRKP